ncbi:MAG: PleD family two-component system response regulator, partial [Candidatus Hydrothermarchaeaceae archaeon]
KDTGGERAREGKPVLLHTTNYWRTSMSRIMIVDDEPNIMVLTRKMLEKKGYEVSEAKSGEECLKRLKQEKPDLILLDVMLRGEDGWEICKKIKSAEETKGIPVVMFTIRGSEDSVEKSMECGADAHISKPFDMEDLQDTVERLLGKTASL